MVAHGSIRCFERLSIWCLLADEHLESDILPMLFDAGKLRESGETNLKPVSALLLLLFVLLLFYVLLLSVRG